MKYKRNSKEYDLQDRLRHRGIYCISREWVKWAKKYTNRATRRKEKMRKYE